METLTLKYSIQFTAIQHILEFNSMTERQDSVGMVERVLKQELSEKEEMEAKRLAIASGSSETTPTSTPQMAAKEHQEQDNNMTANNRSPPSASLGLAEHRLKEGLNVAGLDISPLPVPATPFEVASSISSEGVSSDYGISSSYNDTLEGR